MRAQRDRLVPAVRKELWTRISSQLKAPDFRYTRKMGLLHESPIPNITTSIPIQRDTHSRDDNCLYYFFGQALAKRDIRPSFDHLCFNCYGNDIRVQSTEGTAICGLCGTVQYQVEQHNTTCFQQSCGPPVSTRLQRPNVARTHTSCFHKRKNHFKYWLCRIQGKETSKVTHDVIDHVRVDLALHHELPAYETIRAALRRLKLVKFYNNTYYIQKRLTGYALLDLTRGQEQKLITMFVQIQQPFAKHACNRVNMLYYSYLIRKFAEVLGWIDVANCLPALKSNKKTRQLDSVWKHICQELQLPFIRSV